MRTSDGTYVCDGCGTSVGNGGVDQAAYIGTLRDGENGPEIVGMHACRKNGCVDRVVTALKEGTP